MAKGVGADGARLAAMTYRWRGLGARLVETLQHRRDRYFDLLQYEGSQTGNYLNQTGVRNLCGAGRKSSA